MSTGGPIIVRRELRDSACPELSPRLPDTTTADKICQERLPRLLQCSIAWCAATSNSSLLLAPEDRYACLIWMSPL